MADRELTKRMVAIGAALAFKTPPIEIYLRPAESGAEWRCDIDCGAGHCGIGKTPAEALINAALAWRSSEQKDHDG